MLSGFTRTSWKGVKGVLATPPAGKLDIHKHIFQHAFPKEWKRFEEAFNIEVNAGKTTSADTGEQEQLWTVLGLMVQKTLLARPQHALMPSKIRHSVRQPSCEHGMLVLFTQQHGPRLLSALCLSRAKCLASGTARGCMGAYVQSLTRSAMKTNVQHH